MERVDMGIVFGAIAPHGFTIIPEMSESADGALQTRAAMEELGRRFDAARPDVVVIAGPHGFRVDGSVVLANVGRGAGTLRWKGRQVEMNVPVDLALTDAIAERARATGVPIAMAGYAGNSRWQSVMPLDWGVITPLWYAGHGRNMVGHGDVLSDAPEGPEGPSVVIASPSRFMPRTDLVAFGEAVAEAAEADGRRVAFIASCDWGHRHDESGPYGFHPASAIVDQRVVQAVKAERLLDLMAISDEEARDAAVDGLWQALMLAGVIEKTPMTTEVLSYEAPTYYGMIVAAYTPA
jgi:aromatic ring-opening dioxygenase LigB subunit